MKYNYFYFETIEGKIFKSTNNIHLLQTNDCTKQNVIFVLKKKDYNKINFKFLDN